MRDLRQPISETRNGICSIAVAVIGSSVIGAGASMIGSSNAAKAQENAANQANATQTAMYNQTRADLSPYNTAGQAANNALTYGLGTGTNDPKYATGGDSFGSLAAPVTMDQATLEATPGYQFNLSQGLKATQNAAAGRGLGVSGAAFKGAGTYATGLADSTYQNQFNNQITNQTNTYNRLMGVTQTGENAAAQTGAYGTQTAANIAQTQLGAGNAAAAANVAGGNAIAGAAGNIGNYYYANSLMNGGGGGMYGGASLASTQAGGAPFLY